jgi:hypothetical protein
MIRFISAIISLAIFLSLSGCKHSTDANDLPRKDPRTYTWTIDTLYLPGSLQTQMKSIWGSSSKDVYVTGRNSDPWGSMYHFDGTRWSEVNLRPEHGGYIDNIIDMRSIIGFSENNIWAGGCAGYQEGGHLIHYNGNKWTTVKYPYNLMGTQLWCMTGTSSNDLWLGGENTNYTFHYNGSTWRKDSLPIIIPTYINLGDEFILRSIISDNIGNIYAIGDSHYQSEPPLVEIKYFFSWKNSQWKLLDSAIFSPQIFEFKWGYNDLWMSPSNTLYSTDSKIYKMQDGKWVMMYDAINNLEALSGSSDNNIFVVGDFGTVLHYNGTDWYTLPVYNDPITSYYGVWTDGTEVFIVGVTSTFPNKSVVIHGK